MSSRPQHQNDFDAMMTPPNLLDMFINSTNVLVPDVQINQAMPPTWNDRPPLFQRLGPEAPRWLQRLSGKNPNATNWEEEDPNLLKGMIRKGVPPPLRCAVWMSNVIQSCHPQEQLSEAHAYRTLAKVRVLDHGYQSIWNVSTKLEDVRRLDFGNPAAFERLPDNANYVLLEQVLWALSQTILLEYAPMVPTLATILLSFMSESYVFSAIREMAHAGAHYYFPTTKCEVFAYESAFVDVLEKLHPSTAQTLKANGYESRYAKAIFRDLFATLFVEHPEHVYRIVDIYTLEGAKVLFRFGVALIVLYHRDCRERYRQEQQQNDSDNNSMNGSSNRNEEYLDNDHLGIGIGDTALATSASEDDEFDQNTNNNNNNKDWWNGLVEFCAFRGRMNFDILVKKAYGVHGKGVRKRYRFPRRPILQRIIQLEEERYWKQKNSNTESEGGGSSTATSEQNGSNSAKGDDKKSNNSKDNDDKDGYMDDDDMYDVVQPLGLVPAKPPDDPLQQELVVPKLASPTLVRQKLAEWLPLSLRFTKLNLIFSTDYHGRTLDQFYKHCQTAKHTITLIEPLVDENENCPKGLIIGMYASQIWHASSRVYGDGACSLFRIIPGSEDDYDKKGGDEKAKQSSTSTSQCWKWHPKQLLEEVHDEDDEDDDTQHVGGGTSAATYPTTKQNNRTALLEQFQVGTREYISMGGNSDGSAGLRLNEDLTKGESSAADGYDNVPLAGKDFEVGLVEVYQIVRQIDGVGIR